MSSELHSVTQHCSELLSGPQHCSELLSGPEHCSELLSGTLHCSKLLSPLVLLLDHPGPVDVGDADVHADPAELLVHDEEGGAEGQADEAHHHVGNAWKILYPHIKRKNKNSPI